MNTPKLSSNLATKLKIGTLAGVIALAIPGAAMAQGTSGSFKASGPHGSASSSFSANHGDGKSAQVRLAAQTKDNDDQAKLAAAMNAREQALNQKVGNFKGSVQKQLSGLNAFYGMIQGYVTDNSLTVTNYTTLNTNAANAQTAATAAVNGVSTPSLTPGDNDQDEFNGSIKNAQSALHAYKQSLVALFSAVVGSQ